MESRRERKNLNSRFFESALKEKFYQLCGKYNPEGICESMNSILGREEVKTFFRRAWTGDLGIEEALDRLEDYMAFVEGSMITAQEQA